jgi:tetratricopeptide (TPR) repeat protein
MAWENPQGLRRIVATALPELENPVQAKAALAQLGRARRFQEAASLAAKAAALWPDDADFRGERAKHLLAAGALLEAEAAAREVLLAEASDAQKEAAWIILADALIRQERDADAREALREACFALPGSVALQARRGHQAAQAGDYPEVIDAYQAARDLVPEREVLHLGLLNGLWMAKRYALGSAAAARAVEQFPESAALRQQQASFLLAEGRAAEAIAVARTAVDLAPKNPSAHWALVDALWRQDRFNEAFRMLEAACEAIPGNAFLLNELARLSVPMARRDSVIKFHRKAIELPDASPDIWNILIRALIEEQKFTSAAAVARRALLAHAQAVDFGSSLAEALLLEGKTAAEASCDIASSLDMEAESLIVRHFVTGGLLALGRWDEAIAHLEEIRLLQPDQPDLLLKFGIALTGRGAFREAIALLLELTEKHPAHVDAWEALCDAYRQAKEIKNAIATYRRLEALKPPRPKINRLRARLFGEEGI